tara:strand:- start:17 stop:250 length:234 start_codon:yes stop_codon:yes gene_type:complete
LYSGCVQKDDDDEDDVSGMMVSGMGVTVVNVVELEVMLEGWKSCCEQFSLNRWSGMILLRDQEDRISGEFILKNITQ